MKYLSRHIEGQILESAKHFKAVLLLGARQVGKSTLFSHLFPDTKTIVFDPVLKILDLLAICKRWILLKGLL
jgi:predicted AAA+ superfamily ATPase